MMPCSPSDHMCQRTQATIQSRSAFRHDESGAVLVLALMFAFVVSLIVWGIAEWAGNDLKNTANFETNRAALYAAGGAVENAIQVTGATAPTQLASALTAGSTYTSVSVSALPTQLNAGVMITVTSTNGSQSMTLSSTASAGATTLSVTGFTSTYSQAVGSAVNLGICPGGESASTGSPITIGGQSVSVWCDLIWFPQLGDPTITRSVTFSACPSSVSQTACTASKASYVRAVVYYDDYNTPQNVDECTSPTNESSCDTGQVIHSWVVQAGG